MRKDALRPIGLAEDQGVCKFSHLVLLQNLGQSWGVLPALVAGLCLGELRHAQPLLSILDAQAEVEALAVQGDVEVAGEQGKAAGGDPQAARDLVAAPVGGLHRADRDICTTGSVWQAQQIPASSILLLCSRICECMPAERVAKVKGVGGKGTWKLLRRRLAVCTAVIAAAGAGVKESVSNPELSSPTC